MKTKSLTSLLFTQFVGAFNDNAWKIMVFTLATREVLGSTLATQTQATLSMVIFLLPMLLFSILAAPLADWISKRTVIILTKFVEVVLMTGAALSLFFAPKDLLVPYSLLALMGAQSAIFSPAKYGIIPELVSEKQLSWGNGLLEMYTMLAIIAGTGLGPILLGWSGATMWLAPAALALFSCVGLIAALRIPHVPAAGTRSYPLQAARNAWSVIWSDRVLYLGILGSAIYWMIFSLLCQHILVYAKLLVDGLGRGEFMTGLPPAAFGIGLGIGALLCGRLSRNGIEYGFIPFGAIGFALFSMLLGTIQPAMLGTIGLLLPLGMSCGMIAVPLNAICQQRSPIECRGAILGLSNVLNLAGMIIGSVLATIMAQTGMTLQTMLIISSCLSLAATVWALRLLPEALVRLGFIILTRSFYNLRIRGNAQIEGGALLVCNHMSMTDAFLILASVGRPIRFIMDEKFYNRPWIRPIAKLIGAIPISPTPRGSIGALKKAGKLIDEGELVCIFPEGQISRTGMMQDFHRGAEFIVKGRECPIIPIHLDNLWGSLTSFERGRFLTKLPRRFVWPVTISFGDPLPSRTPIHKIRQAVKNLESDAWMERSKDAEAIHNTFIRHATRAPWKTALIDREKKVSRHKLLASALCLRNSLKREWAGQKNVGIMLPPTIAAVAVNLAVALTAKTSVNLNYTTGTEQLSSTAKQAELRTVITSRAFLEKVKVTLPENLKIIYLEDIAISRWSKLTSALVALFPLLSRTNPDDLLTVIFTSGSTGTPKGVMLTHFNIDSNVTAVSQVMPCGKNQSCLLHTLPLFHSFGYMSMWLGLSHNIPLVLHPDPLDGLAIGQLAAQHKVSTIFTTPTFLRVYMRRIAPQQLGSVNCILTGAEKLPTDTADNFADQFGIKPIEGYGVTECAPVIAASTLDIRKKGIYQPGSKKGSVGQSLPGVYCKVVDPETYAERPPNEEGLLLIRGPNVMQGYLGREDLTREVLREGWYVTGDIAIMNADGYIHIIDRLSRFSKIGGEMVPHGKIEDALNSLINSTERIFAVTAVPDPMKGERIAVLYTCAKDLLQEVYEQLDLPKLFMPRLSDFVAVKELPLLGSGKLDLKSIRIQAIEVLG